MNILKTFDTDNYLNTKGETDHIFTTEGHFFSLKNVNFNSKKNSNRDLFKVLNDKLKPSSKVCKLKMLSNKFFKLRSSLPMKINHFNRLFDMVGIDENIEKLLERKSI